MSNTTSTYTIETADIPALNKMVDRYNKKATKHNFNKIEFTLDNTRLAERKEYTSDELLLDTYNVEVVDVTVLNIITNIEGYEFLGMAKTIDGIPAIHNFTKQDEDGKHAIDLHGFKGTHACDHCGHNRNRSKVFLLTNDGGKTIKQIGSTCVNDYINGSASDIASYFDFVANFFHEMNDFGDSERGGSGLRSYPITHILYNALYIAKSIGYVTVTQSNNSEGGLTATKEVTVSLTCHNDRTLTKDLAEAFSDRFKDTEQAKTDIKDEVKQIIEWVAGIDATKSNARDFLEVAQEAYDRGYCTTKLFGYVVGMISFWNNENKTKEEKKDVVESKYVGEIGTRQEFTGVVKTVSAFEGMYGLGYITRIDCGGDVVTYWNLIKEKGVGAEEGDTVNFWASPKKHEEYRGQKQTTISRATKGKILETVK